MTRRFFITATGTDQGKTLVTAALCRQLRRRDRIVAALKPVVSGDPADPAVLLRALGRPVTEEALAVLSPWRFVAALSPDEAARREGRQVKVEEIAEYCERCAGEQSEEGILLIEGAGGVMSPLSEDATNLDLLAKLDCSAILVSATHLGCISQVLTALAALESRSVRVAGLVLNRAISGMQEPETVLSSLRRHLPAGLPVAGVNHLESGAEIWETAPDLTYLVSA